MQPIPTAPTMFRVYYKDKGRQCFHGHDSLKRAKNDMENMVGRYPDVKVVRCQDGAEMLPNSIDWIFPS